MTTYVFKTDAIVITPAVLEWGDDNVITNIFVKLCMERYFAGEWGELDDHDKAVNDDAVKNGGRILGRYEFNIEDDHGNVESLGEEFTLYLITEADRSVTTIMFAEEY